LGLYLLSLSYHSSDFMVLTNLEIRFIAVAEPRARFLETKLISKATKEQPLEVSANG